MKILFVLTSLLLGAGSVNAAVISDTKQIDVFYDGSSSGWSIALAGFTEDNSTVNGVNLFIGHFDRPLSLDMFTIGDVALPSGAMLMTTFMGNGWYSFALDDGGNGPDRDFNDFVGRYQITPIPTALPLMASGIAGLAFLRWRRARC